MSPLRLILIVSAGALAILGGVLKNVQCVAGAALLLVIDAAVSA